MSRKEQNLNTNKNTMTSNESMNRRDVVATVTSQSLNSESYEYFNQNTTSKKYITESPYNTLNQQSNSRYSSNNQSSNSKNISQRKNIQGKKLAVQGNENLSGLKCTCNQSKENFQKNSLKCTCPQNIEKKCTCGQFSKNQESKTYQSGAKTSGQGVKEQSKTTITEKVITYASPNNPSLLISQEMNKNLSSREKGKRIESNICTCSLERTNNFNNEFYKYSKTANITNTNRNYSYDNRMRRRINKKTNIEWNQKCVGQNNESLQILSLGKPELIAQCVQDMQVIQEPKPIQILLPIPQNEIDYPLGLEIRGKNSKEERRALKEAEKLRKQMEIQPLKNEELNILKEYSKIEPHFENLNIDKKEQVFCERKNQRKAFSVEHSEFGFHNDIKNKAWDLITIENHEMNIKGGEKNFNKFNQKVLTTRMNVIGKNKRNWNTLNKAIKTTKMNIERIERKQKPVQKKKVKKIVQESEVELEGIGRNFGPLKIQNKEYNYKGQEKEKEEEKTKYEKDEIVLDSNDQYQYDAEYPKNVDWNENTIPMRGRPFTIVVEKPKPTLSTNKVEKLSIKESYKTKDWNDSVKEKNEIKINMPTKKVKRPNMQKERIKPVIIKGKENNWNEIVKQENDSKLQIDKSEKKNDFVLTKEKEIYIENEPQEVLINDDYNIIEENYSRPVRAIIRKIEDYTEESASSEYDILNNIKKHETQFNLFKELVYESIKVNGQKIIINDISGQYPRKPETFKGLDENFQKFANDQVGQKKTLN